MDQRLGSADVGRRREKHGRGLLSEHCDGRSHAEGDGQHDAAGQIDLDQPERKPAHATAAMMASR